MIPIGINLHVAHSETEAVVSMIEVLGTTAIMLFIWACWWFLPDPKFEVYD